MTMMKHLLVLACLASACSSAPSVERATIGNLAFDVPEGWSRRDLTTHQRAMFEWTPRDNERKESITVIRVERAALAKSGGTRVERLLREAQQNLPQGTFGVPSQITTKQGFHGVRIEGQFRPAGQPQAYQRIHAVLVDGAALLHVIYTARDADREAFELVVDSFHLDRGA